MPVKFLKKLSPAHFLIITTVFLATVLVFLINIKSAQAQIPPPYKKCDQTDNPEFHSLRPYQASPCNTNLEELSRLCGNQFYVRDDIVVSPDDASSCNVGKNSATCSFDLDRKFYMSINTFESELPIMGNTEDVVNSQNQNDFIDDATKVNEYVSWYLNGVTGRAEYPPLDPENEDDLKKVTSLTGPLKKLLPNETQKEERREIIFKAKEERHDQVIGCVYNLLGGLNVGQITQCYPDDTSIRELRLTDWENHLPPKEEDYENFLDYWVEYKKWRGQSCIRILGIVICVDNPLKPNYWSNLYTYIPLSSTEDREGKLTAHDAVWQVTSELTVTDLQTNWRDKPRDARNQNTQNNESVMYFPHMEESVELVNILQPTYLAKDLIGNQVDGPTETPNPGQECKILNIRYNEGDQLFGEKIVADVKYKAKFECEFPVKFNFKKGVYEPFGTCKKEAFFKSNIDTDTPKVDELWTKTVAGNASVFKRFMSKIESGAPLEKIEDIPTVSDVNYETDINLLIANPQIYFPHIGGVYEYFLKTIQTLLRPKGMGELLATGQTPGSSSASQCSYSSSAIDSAINKAASKYNVPSKLLRAIFEIEGLDYLHNPDNYVCKENRSSAAGLMQITKSTYNIVTCDNERIQDDLAACEESGNRFSRCDVNDAFELAARTLLWKAGMWNFSSCSQYGDMPTDKQSMYDAACKYYGSFSPDNLTINLSMSIPVGQRRNGDMNYCDIVCYKMGVCPPYP